VKRELLPNSGGAKIKHRVKMSDVILNIRIVSYHQKGSVTVMIMLLQKAKMLLSADALKWCLKRKAILEIL